MFGAGAFGNVKVAVYHDFKVAVKQLHEDLLLSPHSIKLFVPEMHILARIKHPNIIQLIGGVMDCDGANVNFMSEHYTKATT